MDLYFIILIEHISSDDDEDDYRRSDKGEVIRDSYHEDSNINVEVFREKTIEDLIDDQRAKLAAEGKVLYSSKLPQKNDNEMLDAPLYHTRYC